MKVRYSVEAYVWNKEREEYERITMATYESDEEAKNLYERTEATADVNQIEIWEELIDRYGVERDRRRIALKDTSGEYDPRDI